MRVTYNKWIESSGVPVYKGYYIEDLRTLKLGWWKERGCDSAFIELAGQEGVSETKVTEIPPGETLTSWKFALDEIIYVLEGRGLTTVWQGQRETRKTFEWQKYSLFLIPGHYSCQLSNAQGDKPARLLHYNYLPHAMQALGDPKFFFNNPYEPAPDPLHGLEEFYSEAKAVMDDYGGQRRILRWYGNFFPDMRAWDKLVLLEDRGAGGLVVMIHVPDSTMTIHMSVFPSRTYKKAHRHGPGFSIVIPAGEGYSIMWEGEKEKVVIPWHEASLFVPPNRWFHQHFNVGPTSARYLAFHPPPILARMPERVEDRARDQIEYPDEDRWIRQKFEEELTKRGLTSLMPEQAYKDRSFEWESTKVE